MQVLKFLKKALGDKGTQKMLRESQPCLYISDLS